MTKRERLLKRLAESHAMAGRRISIKEYNMLKESKWAHLLDRSKVNSAFNTVVESFSEPRDTNLSKSRYMSNPHINRSAINELVEDIEEKFLDGGSGSYRNINLDTLKQFIIKYMHENEIDSTYNPATFAYLDTLLHQQNNVYELMHSLHLHASADRL